MASDSSTPRETVGVAEIRFPDDTSVVVMPTGDFDKMQKSMQDQEEYIQKQHEFIEEQSTLIDEQQGLIAKHAVEIAERDAHIEHQQVRIEKYQEGEEGQQVSRVAISKECVQLRAELFELIDDLVNTSRRAKFFSLMCREWAKERGANPPEFSAQVRALYREAVDAGDSKLVVEAGEFGFP